MKFDHLVKLFGQCKENRDEYQLNRYINRMKFLILKVKGLFPVYKRIKT